MTTQAPEGGKTAPDLAVDILKNRLFRLNLDLYRTQPFWASVIERCRIRASRKTKLVDVNPKGIIRINPEAAEALSDEGMKAVLLHQISHLIYRHHDRRGTRDKKVYTAVADAVVNHLLSNQSDLARGLGEMNVKFPAPTLDDIAGATKTTRAHLETLTTEEIADLLEAAGGGGGSCGQSGQSAGKTKPGKGSGKGQSDGKGQGQSGGSSQGQGQGQGGGGGGGQGQDGDQKDQGGGGQDQEENDAPFGKPGLGDDMSNDGDEGENDSDGEDDGDQELRNGSMSEQITSGEKNWTEVAVAAAVMSKHAGKLPGDIERLIEQMLTPQIDWAQQLAEYVRHMAASGMRRRSTWKRPSRRKTESSDFIMPGRQHIGAPKIAFAVDTSGSMSAADMNKAIAEIDAIRKQYKADLYLIEADAEIADAKWIKHHEAIPGFKGGGGTSFVPVIQHIAEDKVDVDLLIYFTDGYGEFGDKPDYPVLWIMTSDIKPPYGDTVQVK